MHGTLIDDVKAAKAMGLTYGKWRAMQYAEQHSSIKEQKKPRPSKASKTSKRRFTDQQAFDLWSKGLSDSEIAKALNVSRQCVQKWRDLLELPSKKNDPETQKYQLIQTSSGTFVIKTIE